MLCHSGFLNGVREKRSIKEEPVNLEDYIKDLAPELQEKGRACGSVEELLALAKEAQIAVPDEVLEAIAGGADVKAGSCKPKECPRCGSKNVEFDLVHDLFVCAECGYKWR